MEKATNIILGIGIMIAVFGVGTSIVAYTSARIPTFLHSPIRTAREVYTLRRWTTNEWQIITCAVLWQATIWQITLDRTPVPTLSNQLDYHSRLVISIVNLIGASISFYGLHLRDVEVSLWVELCGYVSLVGTLGIWVTLVYVRHLANATSYGVMLTLAFVLASIFRSIKILRYKRSLRHPDPEKQDRLRSVLSL